MQALPNAKAVLHPRGAPHMVDPSKLIAGSIEVYGEAHVPASCTANCCRCRPTGSCSTEDGLRLQARRAHVRIHRCAGSCAASPLPDRPRSPRRVRGRQLRHLLSRVRYRGRAVHAADDDAGAVRAGRDAPHDRPAAVVPAATHRADAFRAGHRSRAARRATCTRPSTNWCASRAGTPPRPTAPRASRPTCSTISTGASMRTATRATVPARHELIDDDMTPQHAGTRRLAQAPAVTAITFPRISHSVEQEQNHAA